MKVPLLLRLPAEILTYIFEDVVASCYGAHKELRKYVLVCHRLTQVVLPLLYCDVLAGVASRTALESLFAALQRRPGCRESVKRLEVQIPDFDLIHRRNFYIVCDIITCITNVKALTFCGGWERYPDQTWGLVHRASQSMPTLESLTLSCVIREGLTVRDILENVQMPSLRQLELDGVALPTGGRTVGAEQKANKPSCLPASTKATAHFSTLRIRDYQENSAATRELILWPRALIHFHASLLGGSNPECDLDLSKLSAWLSAHKDTLETIHIGYIHKFRPDKLFQTRGFNALERLTLSWWHIRGYVTLQQDEEHPPFGFTPAHADALLCAPRLTTLELDYGESGHVLDSCHVFGEVEARWIRGLAHAARARQAALQTICVRYRPQLYCLAEILEYPWDRLTQLREDLQPFEIGLEYDEPSFSEEEWAQARMQASPPWEAMRWSESPPLDDGILFGCGLSKDGEPSLEEQEAWEYAHKAI
ncbi:hypothetical protein BO99DRAFT_375036 [Aspergillus violaceofuscus CBS 115571]|uniref:F-box domain-containing protein n=1 Tax=Aspergillus violaceofuscus (strain CBS 115571) TaxID=1450538 RepID=A0A2V5HID7_ASPV1|nr:hypothetical protein BO99DRAFT_375036 [Aspergillus violaceofuscus CBS 115571]